MARARAARNFSPARRVAGGDLTPVETAWANLQRQYPALTQGVDFATQNPQAMNAANTQTLHAGIRNQGVIGYGAPRYRVDSSGRRTPFGGLERVDERLAGPRAEFVTAKELGQANYGRFMTRARSDLFQDAYGLPRGRPWMAASAQGRAEQHLSGTPRDWQGAPEEFDPRRPSPGGATSPADLYGALFAGALGRVRPEGVSTLQLTGDPLQRLMREGVVPRGPGLATPPPPSTAYLQMLARQRADAQGARYVYASSSPQLQDRMDAQPQMTGDVTSRGDPLGNRAVPRNAQQMMAIRAIARAQMNPTTGAPQSFVGRPASTGQAAHFR